MCPWRTERPAVRRHAPDSNEGTVARPLGHSARIAPPYGSSTSFVPWASDVAAVLKAFERSAEAPAVFGTQK